jgi:hypothetical protein
MPTYYDKNLWPITLEEWMTKLNDPHYCTIMRTQLLNGILVSTVWLGLDHGFDPEAKKPVIFESMVFKSAEVQNSKYQDLECQRYSTEEEAMIGHTQLITRYKTYQISNPTVPNRWEQVIGEMNDRNRSGRTRKIKSVTK